MVLAMKYTGKDEFLYFDNALHGRTYMTMAVNGLDMWRPFDEFSIKTHKIKSFYPKLDELHKRNQYEKESLLHLETLLEENKDKIAGLLIEPIQGNGGILLPGKKFFKKVKELCDKYKVLIIDDEVQTGFSRTGSMFAIEHYDIVPDIIVCAKALGNGFSIGSFSTTEEIASCFTNPSASTLGGNPLASINSINVIDYHLKKNLAKRSEHLGNFLESKLVNLKNKYSIIKDVRGMGLMQGVEICYDDYTPAPEIVDLILEKMKDRGFLIGKNGKNRNVIAFQPPLIISKRNIIKMIENLDEVIKNIGINQ